MRKILIPLILATLLLVYLPVVMAEDDSKLSNEDMLLNVEQVLTMLDDHYVYPQLAYQMREFVELQISTGRYADIDSLADLIIHLQADLRAQSNDGHISLHLAEGVIDRSTPIRTLTESDELFIAEVLVDEDQNKAIGFLQFNKFNDKVLSKERLAEAMSHLSDAESLIIDLRKNIGGDPYFVALLSSYFFDTNTHLWSILDRYGEPVFESYSQQQPSKYDGNVCILISETTYSAAEAFAYTMKHQGQACIVGEASGGGAHLVDMRQVNDTINIRLPELRAYNPITKSNWQGVGVLPTLYTEVGNAKAAALNYLKNTNKQ